MSDEEEILRRMRACTSELPARDVDARQQAIELVLVQIERAVSEDKEHLVLGLDEILQQLEGGVPPASRRRGTPPPLSYRTSAPRVIHVIPDQIAAHMS